MSARNTVKFTLDTNNPPPLKPAQQTRLKAVATMPDSDIGYSDLPRQTSTVKWTRPGALIPAGNKQQVTQRLDADVLSFFKDTGTRYQSRINAALREYMNAHDVTRAS